MDNHVLLAAPGRTFLLGGPKVLNKKLEELSRNTPVKSQQKRVTNELQSSVSRRATLPFMPLSLTFNDIRYSVDMPKVKTLLILSNQNF